MSVDRIYRMYIRIKQVVRQQLITIR